LLTVVPVVISGGVVTVMSDGTDSVVLEDTRAGEVAGRDDDGVVAADRDAVEAVVTLRVGRLGGDKGVGRIMQFDGYAGDASFSAVELAVVIGVDPDEVTDAVGVDSQGVMPCIACTTIGGCDILGGIKLCAASRGCDIYGDGADSTRRKCTTGE
jgi:hypothetical protein